MKRKIQNLINNSNIELIFDKSSDDATVFRYTSQHGKVSVIDNKTIEYIYWVNFDRYSCNHFCCIDEKSF
jgi:hypothetical protein